MPTETPTMTERSAKLLRVLRSFNGWTTHSLITAQLGADQLDGRYLVALNLLIERGLIEVRYAAGGVGRTLEYRFVAADDEADTQQYH